MDDNQIAPEWVALFQGKTAAEITETRMPASLSDEEAFRFREYQIDRADEEAAREDGKPYVPRVPLAQLYAAKPAREKSSPYGDTADALDHGYGFETGCETSQATAADPLPPLVVPNGSTDVLLDRQIALCGGIIEHLAHYVTRYDTDPHNCNNFMDRIVSMMNSSANVAKMVGRLRGSLQPDEKQLRQIIQREDAPREKPPSPRSVQQ